MPHRFFGGIAIKRFTGAIPVADSAIGSIPVNSKRRDVLQQGTKTLFALHQSPLSLFPMGNVPNRRHRNRFAVPHPPPHRDFLGKRTTVFPQPPKFDRSTPTHCDPIQEIRKNGFVKTLRVCQVTRMQTNQRFARKLIHALGRFINIENASFVVEDEYRITKTIEQTMAHGRG